MTDMHDPTPNSRRYAWFVLVMMVLLYLINVADRNLAAGLLVDIKKTFEVSDTFMGFLVGPTFAIVYTFLAIPIAIFADRSNRVKIIVAGAFVWSGFTVLSGLVQTPWGFAFARLGVGVGEAAFLAPAFSIMSDYFPPKKRALAFAILNFGTYFGQIFGLVGGAAIAQAYNWQTAFISLGIPGILLGAFTLVFVREPMRGRLDEAMPNAGAHSQKIPFLDTFTALLARRSFCLMALGTAFGGFASYGVGFWGPTFFARAFDLSITEANMRYGGGSFVAGITGALLLGVVCDRLTAKDVRWPFRLSAIGLLGFGLSMMVMCFAKDPNIATLMTIPAGLMGGGWVIAMQAALQDLLPAKARATGTALWGFALTFSGMALGVWFVGLMNDVFVAQFGDQAIRYALAVTLLIAIPSMVCILLAGQSVDEDRKILAKTLG